MLLRAETPDTLNIRGETYAQIRRGKDQEKLARGAGNDAAQVSKLTGIEERALLAYGRIAVPSIGVVIPVSRVMEQWLGCCTVAGRYRIR